jgi:hypothetical protein
MIWREDIYIETWIYHSTSALQFPFSCLLNIFSIFTVGLPRKGKVRSNYSSREQGDNVSGSKKRGDSLDSQELL